MGTNRVLWCSLISFPLSDYILEIIALFMLVHAVADQLILFSSFWDLFPSCTVELSAYQNYSFALWSLNHFHESPFLLLQMKNRLILCISLRYFSTTARKSGGWGEIQTQARLASSSSIFNPSYKVSIFSSPQPNAKLSTVTQMMPCFINIYKNHQLLRILYVMEMKTHVFLERLAF